MSFIIGLLIGLVIGALIGVMTMALVVASDDKEKGVIVPPCKVGDRVYSIFVGDTKIVRNFIDPNGDKITQIKINHKGCHFKCWWGYFHISDIGKTVFLTKEEAEAKLKELGK